MAFRTVDYKLDPDALSAGGSYGIALAAGRLFATVVSEKTGKHIAVACRAKRKMGRRFEACDLIDAERIYLDTPTPEGPGTEIGCLHLVGKWEGKIMPPWEKEFDDARVWAARRVLDVAQGRQPVSDGKATIMQGKDCLVCNRPLTDPESIARNIGPTCWGNVTGSEHHKRGEDMGFGTPETEIHEGLPVARRPMEVDGLVGGSLTGKTYTEAEVIANDKRHADIEQIETEERLTFEQAEQEYIDRRGKGEIEDPAEFAKRVVEGSTREAIEAELQQSVVEGNTEADLGAPEAERTDLHLVPADADPREILKGIS